MGSARSWRRAPERTVIMPLGDGIRRNIASVDPAERALLRDAFVELNRRVFPGSRTDLPAGGVSWWFKQDEIHQATHVHDGPEFLPWHRVIVNRLEEAATADQPPAVAALLGLDAGPACDPERQSRRRSARHPEPVHAGLHGLWGLVPAPDRRAVAERAATTCRAPARTATSRTTPPIHRTRSFAASAARQRLPAADSGVIGAADYHEMSDPAGSGCTTRCTAS